MVQKLRQRMGREEGFTLVELLVVMLILGLLAAIAIPSFFNQRDKARDADAKSAARTAQTAIETFATDNNGSYLTADSTKLIAIEPTLQDVSATLTVNPTSATGYIVSVDSAVAGQSFSITRANTGATTLACTTAGKGGCPQNGRWD